MKTKRNRVEDKPCTRFTLAFIRGTIVFGGMVLCASAFAAPPETSLSENLTNGSSVRERVTFAKALSLLSNRCHLAFIAEDQPDIETIPVTVLDEALRNVAGGSDGEAAQPAIQKIAEAFDYDSVRSGATVLLRKTYKHSPNAIPCVTFQECLLTVRGVKPAVGALNPNVSPFNGADYPLGDPIMKSLTQDQLSAMFNGLTSVTTMSEGRPIQGVTIEGTPTEGWQQRSSKGTIEVGLPVRSLTPPQRAAVQRIAAYEYIQLPIEAMQDEAVKLEACANPEAVFRFETVQVSRGPALRALGCVLPPRAPGGKKRWFYLFSEYDPKFGMTQVPTAYYEAFKERYDIVSSHLAGWPAPENASELSAMLTQSMAGVQEAETAGRESIENIRRHENGPSETLSSAAARLNARATPSRAPREDTARVSVDPALSAKRVTLVGTENLLRLSIWTGIARLYDLTTHALPGGSVVLTSHRPKAARSFAEVPDAMEHVLPLPLRCFADNDLREALQRAAFCRFRVNANQLSTASPTGEFTLNDLGEAGQRDLALELMGYNSVGNILRLSAPVPDYIANFDKRVILGGLLLNKKGEMIFSFFLGKEVMPGVLAQGVGFGAVHYRR